jgi:hypothetical protein
MGRKVGSGRILSFVGEFGEIPRNDSSLESEKYDSMAGNGLRQRRSGRRREILQRSEEEEDGKGCWRKVSEM